MLLLSACGGSSTVSLDSGNGPNPNPNANATLAFDQVVNGSNASLIYGAVSQGIEFGARAHLSDVGTDAFVTGKGVTIAARPCPACRQRRNAPAQRCARPAEAETQFVDCARPEKNQT